MMRAIKRGAAAKKAAADLDATVQRQKNAELQLPSLSLNIDVQLSAEQTSETVIIHHRFHYFAGPAEVTVTGEHVLPTNVFSSAHQIEQFAHAVNLQFTNSVSEVINSELLLHLDDITYNVMNRMQLAPVNLTARAKRRAKETQKAVLQRFGLYRAGRPPQWEKYELVGALFRAIKSLPKKEQTYANAARVLKEVYGDKAPDSGEALRKMVERMEIDWKGLKNGLYV